MRQVHVIVEGQTEQGLIRDFFGPALAESGVYLTPSLIGRRGGVSRNGWDAIAKDIQIKLKSSHLAAVTTLIDYYAAPRNTPGMADRPVNGTAVDRVRHVEGKMAEAFGSDPRFVPHLALHEAETWVLAAAEHLGAAIGLPRVGRELRAQVEAGSDGAESVNDGPASAPSKRVKAACAQHGYAYSKTGDGIRALQAFTLPALRKACPHLDAWLTTIVGPVS